MYLQQIDNYLKQYETESAIAGRIFGVDQIQNAIPMLNIDQNLIESIKAGNKFDTYLEGIK